MAAARPQVGMTAPETRDTEGSRGSAEMAEMVVPEDAESRVPAARKRWWLPLVKLALTVAVTWLILRGAGIRLSEVWTVDWALVQLDAALSAPVRCAALRDLRDYRRAVVPEPGGNSMDAGLAWPRGPAILLIGNLGKVRAR